MNNSCVVLYLKQQVVLQDPLDRLQQVGAQREGALQSGLPVLEEGGQRFTPHAVGQCCHGAGGQKRAVSVRVKCVPQRKYYSKDVIKKRVFELLTWDSWCNTAYIYQSIPSEETEVKTNTPRGFISVANGGRSKSALAARFLSPYRQSIVRWPPGRSHTCLRTAAVH